MMDIDIIVAILTPIIIGIWAYYEYRKSKR
jgi:hypothetical protein